MPQGPLPIYPTIHLPFYLANPLSSLAKHSIPHSLLCNYNFTVMASSASQTPTVCALTLQGPDYLPEVPLQGCSGSPVYSWAVSAAPADDGDGVAGGLDLTITTALSAGVTNLTGTYLIPEGNLTVTDNGASSSQSYVGPEAFSVPTEVVPVDA